MKKPEIIEVYADNGVLSHYALINIETGEKLWSEAPGEDCEHAQTKHPIIAMTPTGPVDTNNMPKQMPVTDEEINRMANNACPSTYEDDNIRFDDPNAMLKRMAFIKGFKQGLTHQPEVKSLLKWIAEEEMYTHNESLFTSPIDGGTWTIPLLLEKYKIYLSQKPNKDTLKNKAK